MSLPTLPPKANIAQLRTYVLDAVGDLDARVVALAAGTPTPGPTPTPPASGGPITFDPIVTRSGNSYTFTARRTTNLANAESRTITVAGSSTYQPAALASDFGGFPSVTAAFLAGASTTAITIAANAAVQPE